MPGATVPRRGARRGIASAGALVIIRTPASIVVAPAAAACSTRKSMGSQKPPA
jgi:hypothetical protein